MKALVVLLISSLGSLFSLSGFEVTPPLIEVSHERQATSTLTFQLSTNLPDGVSWQSQSDQPFVTISNLTGTTPGTIEVKIDQVKLGQFIASNDSYSAASIAVTANDETVIVPIKLQNYGVSAQSVLWTSTPNEFVIASGNGIPNTLPVSLVRVQADTGLIAGSYEIPEFHGNLQQNPQGTKAYLQQVVGLISDIRAIDLQTLTEESVISIPQGAVLRAAGKDFLLLEGTNPTVVDGQSLRGKFFTFDPATQTLLTVLDFSSYRISTGLQTIMQRKANNGDLLRAGKLRNGGFVVFRIERDGYVEEFNDTLTIGAGPNPSLALPPFMSPNGKHIFLSNGIIDRQSWETRNMARLQQATDSTRDGQLILSSAGLGYSDSDKIISPITDETFPGPRAFSYNDQYIFAANRSSGGKMKFLRTEDLVSIPLPKPVDGAQIASLTPEFSIPANDQAENYQLVITRLIDGEETTVPSASNLITMPTTLERGYRYQWRIDTLTPSEIVTGSTQDLETIFRPAQGIQTQEEVVVGRSLVAFHDTSGEVAEFFEIGEQGLSRSGQVLTLEPSTGTGRSREAAIVGKKFFINSGDGVFTYTRSTTEKWEPEGKVAMPAGADQANFGYHLAAAGDLLFTTSFELGTGVPQVEIYRTQPEIIHTATLKLPLKPGASIPSPWEIELKAAGDTIAVVTPADPNLEGQPVSLFIYQRPDDSLQWTLKEQFSFPSSRRNSPPSIATDGNHIAMVFPNPNTAELVILKRNASGIWQKKELSNEEYPAWSFPNNLTLKNGVLLIDSYTGVHLLREMKDNWTIQSIFRRQDYGGGELNRSAIARDKLILSAFGYSVFNDVFPDIGVPSLDGDINSKVIAGSRYELFLNQQDPDETISLLSDQDWLNIRTTQDGRYLLEGTAPTTPGNSTVIVKAEGTSGLRDFRVFDLEVVEGDLPLQVSLRPSYIQDLIEGESIHVEAMVSGSGELSLQWFKDGIALSDQTSTSLFLPGTDPNDSGQYVLRISNAVEEVATDPIVINVTADSMAGRSWPMMAGGPGQRNFSPASLGTSEPILRWSKSHQGADPVIVNGKIYLSISSPPPNDHQSPVATALNLTDGSEQWRVTPKPGFSLRQPTVAGDQVFFTAKQGIANRGESLISLKTGSGEILWERLPEPSAPGQIPPTDPYRSIASNNRVWIRSLSLGVQSWTLNGEDRLKYDGIGPFGLALTPGHSFLFSYLGGLIDYDPETSLINAETNLKEEDDPLLLSAVDSLAVDGMFGIVEFNRTLRGIDLQNLKQLWETSPLKHGTMDGSYQRSALAGNYIVAANVADSVVLDPDNGNYYYPVLIEILARENGSVSGSISTRIPGSPGIFDVPKLDLVAFNDSFAFSGRDFTKIYDLKTLEERHHLSHGGNLVYGEGFLVINDNSSTGPDRGLHAYQINDRPEIIAPVLTEALEDQEYQFELKARHFEESESLTYELVGEYAWLNITPDGQATLRPTQKTIGSGLEKLEQYTIRISDGVTQPVVQTFAIKLVAVNDDPILSLGDLVTDEDSNAIVTDLSINASDEESASEDLSFEIVADESGDIASVTLEESSLSILPLADQFGAFEITLKVSDPDGGFSRKEITVTINPINDIPELVNPEVSTTAEPNGSDQSLSLSENFSDRDPGDQLRFTIASNTRPELFQGLDLDEQTGELLIQYAPYVSGEATLNIVATDLEGASVSLPVRITLPAQALPTIIAAGQPGVESRIILNHQTGLFEQKVILTNNAARDIGGFSLSVAGLTDGFRLYQNSPTQIVYGKPIGVGETVELTLEYYSVESGKTPTPTLTVVPILPQPQEAAETLGVDIGQMTITDNEAVLLEFESEAGSEYVIQYSFDMATWFNSPTKVTGREKRTQWLDQGLPRTPCHPRDCSTRFYRVLEIIESE